jgi:predicted  nucleic acid-binding Zn-ribbon protein
MNDARTVQVACAEHESERKGLSKQVEASTAEASSLRSKLADAEWKVTSITEELTASVTSAQHQAEAAQTELDVAKTRLERLLKVRNVSDCLPLLQQRGCMGKGKKASAIICKRPVSRPDEQSTLWQQ